MTKTKMISNSSGTHLDELKMLGVIKHLGKIRHRILSNVNTPKVFRQKTTSHFKPFATPIILEVEFFVQTLEISEIPYKAFSDRPLQKSLILKHAALSL